MAQLGLVQLGMVQDGGATRAKRLADIYIKTHSNAEGKVTDPQVYQVAIDSYLAPYADDLTVSSKMATFQNKVKDLSTENSEVNASLEDLKLREYQAWYRSEDVSDTAGIRNPSSVAQVTSENLDILLAETLATFRFQKENGKDTTKLEEYLPDLIKKSDRMRTLAQGLEDGTKQSLDGYGYYIDADPNTGAFRGAALMPTDVANKGISDGTIRTDTYVDMKGTRVPVYLPYTENESGQTQINFAGKQYLGDTKMMHADDASDVILTNKDFTQQYSIPFEGDSRTNGKVYRAFNGQENQDGTPRQDYYFAGYDNKMYRFSGDSPQGKAFLEGMKATGGIDTSSIPRINPYTAAGLNAVPLPDDSGGMQIDAAVRNPSLLNITNKENPPEDTFFGQLGRIPGLLKGNFKNSLLGKTMSGDDFGTPPDAASSFFSRKNRASTPNPAPARTGNDVVDQGNQFFKDRPAPMFTP